MAEIRQNPGPVEPPLAGPVAVHDLGEPAGEHTAGHGGRRRRKTKVSTRVAALNITSFMDLTFNLLLFFVLTASFSLGEGVLPADLPAGGGGGMGASIGPAPPTNSVVITLHAIGMGQTSIQIEGAPVAPADFEDLYQKLKGWRFDAANTAGIYKADNPIIIKPDRNVPWNAVVEAFNAVVRARYTNVGFAPSA